MDEVARQAETSAAPSAAVAMEALRVRAPARYPTLISRAVWAILFSGPVAVFVVAAFLTPDPHGYGTHTQLGLPPCGFFVITGLPCPGCGLTTCFAYMIRGDVVNATSANAFGVMLFLASATMAGIAAIGLVKGWGVIDTLDRLRAERWAIFLAVASLVVWVVRVVTLIAT